MRSADFAERGRGCVGKENVAADQPPGDQKSETDKGDNRGYRQLVSVLAGVAHLLEPLPCSLASRSNALTVLRSTMLSVTERIKFCSFEMEPPRGFYQNSLRGLTGSSYASLSEG